MSMQHRVIPYHGQRSRIPALRPLRPPAVRPFTQHRRRLLLTQYSQRPQLPYLSQSSLHRRLSPVDQQVLRLLSTESRNFVRDYTYLTVKWGTATWIILTLINVTLFGLAQELTENESPTPPEWTLWTRIAVRRAKMEIAVWEQQGYIDWAKVGTFYLQAITRLEDSSIDGNDTRVQEDEATGGKIMIADVGSVGLDISGKSWEWRQGYFEVLMGMAQASENTETMVRDATRNLIFPRSTMIGPSNPDPRPVTKEMAAAPLEENCERPFDPPEKFYMRILTGNGFSTRQKVSAALAYSNWLEYTGLNEAAEEMLKWSVDIAKAPLCRDDVLRPGTFIVDSPDISENLLRAVTEVGAHQARVGNTAGALPILLAVCRARQEAEVLHVKPPQRPGETSRTDFGAVVQAIQGFFLQKSYPHPPSTGNDPFKRVAQPTCEDSELMLYIGEIMYASTSMRAEGLSWTKRAVDIAEKEISQPTALNTDVRNMQDEVRKCKHCLKVGVDNWSFMLDDMTKTSSSTTQKGWLPWSSSRVSDNMYGDTMIQADLARLDQLKDIIIRHSTSIESESIRKSSKFAMYAG